jgi:hypothetical protein
MKDRRRPQEAPEQTDDSDTGNLGYEQGSPNPGGEQDLDKKTETEEH